ncbi:dUTPase-like protein, partial [Coemansia reversa NRRL 1564]
PRTMAKPETLTSTPPRTDDLTTPELKIAEPSAEPARQHKSLITPASTLTVPQSESNSLKVQLLHDKVVLPVKAYDDDAGFDVSCVEPINIAPKMQVTVPLGITAKAPKGTFLQLAPCSGLAKKGIALLGGIVDAGYHGEIKVMLLNIGSVMVSLACGNRVAQLIPVKIELPSATQVDQLNETECGSAGFGSSG